MAKKRETTDIKTLRRAFKFRCDPTVGTRRRLWNALRRAATPVWNSCNGEREAALAEYMKLGDAAIAEQVQHLGRELSEKEEKALRKGAAAQVQWPTAYDQYAHARKKEHPEYKPYSSSMLECAIAKVDGSWKSFMALRKNGDKQARPPRQTNCCHCLTFRKSGWSWPGGGTDTSSQQNRVELMGIGSLKFIKHREIQGKIKTVSITHERSGKWFICFSCEIANFNGVCGSASDVSVASSDASGESTLSSGGSDPETGGTHNLWPAIYSPSPGGSDPETGGTHNAGFFVPRPENGGSDPETPTGKAATVTLYFPGDVFLCDSTGREVEHPEFYFSEIDTLRRLSRSLSRKHQTSPGMKGKREGDFRGRNRRKARVALAKWHEHISAKRDHFLWEQARYYAMNFQQIIVPKWPLKAKIQYAVESRTAMKLLDGSYGKFIGMLKQKAEEFGSEVVEQKNESIWRVEMDLLNRVKRFEETKAVLLKVKKAVKYDNRKAGKSLAGQIKQLKCVEV